MYDRLLGVLMLENDNSFHFIYNSHVSPISFNPSSATFQPSPPSILGKFLDPQVIQLVQSSQVKPGVVVRGELAQETNIGRDQKYATKPVVHKKTYLREGKKVGKVGRSEPNDYLYLQIYLRL